jgi:hypothetical protein
MLHCLVTVYLSGKRAVVAKGWPTPKSLYRIYFLIKMQTLYMQKASFVPRVNVFFFTKGLPAQAGPAARRPLPLPVRKDNSRIL